MRDRYAKSAPVAVALLEKLHLKTSKKLVSGFKVTICCIPQPLAAQWASAGKLQHAKVGELSEHFFAEETSS